MFLPNTRHIAIDDAGWELHGRALHTISWDNEHDDLMTVQFSMDPPDLPVAPSASDAVMGSLRRFFRRGVEGADGGVLEIEPTTVGGVPAVRTLFRFPLRPAPGVVLLGSLTVPFQEWAYVLRVQCPSRGEFTQRHRELFARRMASPDVQVDPATASPVDWLVDRYDPSRAPHRLGWCSADDPRHDATYPDDALSRARRTLAHLERSTRFDDRVAASPPFAGPLARG
jgi:hypothetical protein